MRLHRTSLIQMCLTWIKILQRRQNLSAHLHTFHTTLILPCLQFSLHVLLSDNGLKFRCRCVSSTELWCKKHVIWCLILLTWISIWSSFSSNARFLIISFLRSSLCRNSSTCSLVCTCWRLRSSWDSRHLLVRERDATVPVGFSSPLRSSRSGLLPTHHRGKLIFTIHFV